MDYYDIQQVCLNGHQITDRFNSNPESRQPFCQGCGEKTIYECPNCNHSIEGGNQSDDIYRLFPTPVPDYCKNCGNSYPWAEKTKDEPIESISFKALLWYKKLSTIEKIGLIGSVASLIGLFFVFYPLSRENPQTKLSSDEVKSPSIQANQSNITITYGNNYDKSHVLLNQKGEAVPIINNPKN
ncbi:hypothetical protein BCS42_01420 [Crenothrix sp. D3]|nr:hypothetical protein BCS42_01420 [Crenothrix sp. D3]